MNIVAEHTFKELYWSLSDDGKTVHVYKIGGQLDFKVHDREERDGKVYYKIANNNFIMLDKDLES